jgi:hypothetical protein
VRGRELEAGARGGVDNGEQEGSTAGMGGKRLFIAFCFLCLVLVVALLNGRCSEIVV